MNAPEYMVKPVKLTTSPLYGILGKPYHEKSTVLGWYPAIFGPGLSGSTEIIVHIPALDHIDNTYTDPKPRDLYTTAEAAMAAWEGATPVEFKGRSPHLLMPNYINAINDQKMFRRGR